jgi:uncharacterized protein
VPRKYFRKYLPDPEVVLAKRWAAPFRPWLGHPNLWHLNRRSVSGAVAIGLFAGLIPGPLQMLTALLLAIPFRRNIPVALVATLYTNPLTIVPIYMLAYGYGRLLLPGEHAPITGYFEMDIEWVLALGKPLVVGLIALGLTLALVGYVATNLAWRAWAVSAWRARGRRRKGKA